VIRRLWAGFADLGAPLERHVFDTTRETVLQTVERVRTELASGALDV
jgi:hypothetical protein